MGSHTIGSVEDDLRLLTISRAYQGLPVCKTNFPTAVPAPVAVIEYVPFGSGFGVNGTFATLPCLSGYNYTVVEGDTCTSIAKAKGVSTGALTTVNELYPDCSNLIAGSTLSVTSVNHYPAILEAIQARDETAS